jgi:hypothetical protein
MFLVWLTGRVSESRARCHGYITIWFVSDGTTGVSIVRIKVRLEWRHNRVFNGIHGYTAKIVKGEWLLSYQTTHVSTETGFYCYHTAWKKMGNIKRSLSYDGVVAGTDIQYLTRFLQFLHKYGDTALLHEMANSVRMFYLSPS